MEFGGENKDTTRTGEAGTVDVLDFPVGDEEALLPAHEDDAALFAVAVADGEGGAACLVLEGAEGGEAAPVGHILLLGRAELGVGGEEAVLFSNDLGVKVGGEFGVVVGEALDAEVSAEERVVEIDVLRVGEMTISIRWRCGAEGGGDLRPQ